MGGDHSYFPARVETPTIAGDFHLGELRKWSH